jgi:hypothetical protein
MGSGEAAFRPSGAGKAPAHRPKKKTPREAGFSKMDARVNDNALGRNILAKGSSS